MKLNIRKLLEYFDIKESTDYGDATAVISVVGEDLGSALFKHYRENENKSEVKIIDPNEEIPTEGKKIGRRLDRWIIEKSKNKQILYQTEIKSWCSRAIGGISIPIKISDGDFLEKVKYNWNRDIKNWIDIEVNGLNKVLLEMPTDKKLERLGIKNPYDKKPLLIFWDARSPSGRSDCFSQYSVETKYHYYDYCLVFSCSLYLRFLYGKGETEIFVEMPNAERRIEDLNHLFVAK